MTDKNFDLVAHSLGLNAHAIRNGKVPPPEKDPYYRNYFQTDKGSDDWDTIISMVDSGIMRKRLVFNQNVFHVTEKGIKRFETMWKLYSHSNKR